MVEKTSTTHPEQARHDEPAKTEPTKAESAKSEAAKKPAHAAMRRAAESSDPAVHSLLSQRASYESHAASAELSATEADGTRKVAKDRLDEIDEQLNDLGYTAT